MTEAGATCSEPDLRKRKARLRLPTAGAIISLVLHSAAAAALCAGRDLLSGSGGEWAGASASAVVTVVIDSIVDEAPTDAMASASTVVTPAPEAPVPPALAPPPEPVKDVETR